MEELHKIVFETDTKAGKQFDVFLLWIILLSVVVPKTYSPPLAAFFLLLRHKTIKIKT